MNVMRWREKLLPIEARWFNFVQEGGHTLWGIRVALEDESNKEAISDLISKKLIAIKKHNVILGSKESIRILHENFSYASFWWPMMELVLV